MNVVDLAQSGPPEGEKGTSTSGSIYSPGFNLFGAYDEWTGKLCKEPTAKDCARCWTATARRRRSRTC